MSEGPTEAAPTRPGWADIQAHRPLDPDDPREIGGYRLRARLGEGGMGRVYLSFTPGGRPIAIKVIRPEFAADPAFRRRFTQEVATAHRVQGLYTAPVIDANTEADQPWLATAYVPGPSLQAAVGAYGPLPEESVLVLVAGVAEALQSIHGAGIIHRDLKPSNVILAADGPRVIDFGIARAADTTSVTRTGHQVGTPAFMAPEQVRGLATTPALDIFALGVLACYAATGELPFGGGLDPAVPHRILEQEPDLARCPRRLVDLVTRCLAKDPQRRPSPTQVIELCRTLSTGTRLQMGESWLPPRMAAVVNQIAAAPVPPVPRQPRPRRRRRTAVLLAAGFVVVAAAAGIGVAGAMGAFDTKASGVSGAGGSSSAPTTTTTAATTTTTSGTVSPTAPATSSGATSTANPGGDPNFVKRFDSVDLSASHGIIFNNDAVEDTTSTDSDLYHWTDTGLSTRGEMIILRPEESATFETCSKLTRFVTDLYVKDLQVNTKFCIVTDKQISLWEIRRVPQTNEVSRHYEFAITLWRRST
jgi:hypothetical protein